jgi:hypothetical protein
MRDGGQANSTGVPPDQKVTKAEELTRLIWGSLAANENTYLENNEN